MLDLRVYNSVLGWTAQDGYAINTYEELNS